MGKYSCVKGTKNFSQKLHYDEQEIQTYKIKKFIDKEVNEKLNQLNILIILMNSFHFFLLVL